MFMIIQLTDLKNCNYVCGCLRLEEFYSYTEKIQQKRTRKTKQNKGKLCTANNYIQ